MRTCFGTASKRTMRLGMDMAWEFGVWRVDFGIPMVQDVSPLLYFLYNEHNDDLITQIAFRIGRFGRVILKILKHLPAAPTRTLVGMNTFSFESFVSTCVS
jgi:hypothetical protein